MSSGVDPFPALSNLHLVYLGIFHHLPNEKLYDWQILFLVGKCPNVGCYRDMSADREYVQREALP